ncbi:hypothetical protein COT82_02245 [Candidatus Campbellbacteria bacterium CG10_big_fil_rev_8_21_14_0_10_35_52]|uniref:TRASH domain-containing protein n=1 Tax=Candidatus Campbellbacteria bacterium CG10_big_fil_rev_8_21_14_0_10_35_52 TaxID=1974527 RepID=A0A2M6WUZ8_9BACT|nr:MAG: hypothetical protein COT82_02245 [Candidatus Campbellbacteria bacterium CG10_big_fil_rev_8_21_14_0_10_35_52]
MLNIFKKRCPICKMELAEGKEYPEEYGKKFCLENCREEYRKKIVEEQSKAVSRGGCCGK